MSISESHGRRTSHGHRRESRPPADPSLPALAGEAAAGPEAPRVRARPGARRSAPLRAQPAVPPAPVAVRRSRGAPRLVLAEDPDEEEDREAADTRDHESGGVFDADRAQPDPDEERETERPEERDDAVV